MADEILGGMSSLRCDVQRGRPALDSAGKVEILIALYTVRSDRQFCEQLDYNLLFRWFLDMNVSHRRRKIVEELFG
ncbi:MAG: transposase [Kofleriaceae bacterium]